MEILQQYAKEIFALFIPILTWILNNIFRPRAKLQLARPHGFTFLVDEPLKDEEGNVVSPNQTVETTSHVLRNAGKEPATGVEIVFNWKPPCINIWPPRHSTEHTENDGRYVLKFDSLAPNELISFELFSINRELPRLINARSDQCTAETIEMYPQPVVQSWKQRLAVFLVFSGIAFAVYVGIIILQFLVLGTPFGR
jgi:hypothetical protein